MGFAALVEVAPFFPEGLRDLRGLFARSVLGRALADVGKSSTICFHAVEKLLPRCFSKAAWLLFQSLDSALTVRNWIAQLESIFTSRIRDLAWFDELSTLLVRYRLRRHPVTLFGPNNRPCAPSGPFSTESPLLFYFQVGKHEQNSRQEALAANITELRNHFATSDLNTRAKYDPERMTVHVPMALFNMTVSPNSTLFAFHLSRFAVRYYNALVQVLSENFYERDAPISLSLKSQQELADLVRCLTEDLRKTELDRYSSLNLARLPEVLLDQTMALQLSLKAFHKLLHVRRIWNFDFRFKNLPELSAEQLFFVYYALDNCESTDAVYDAKLENALPARYRVNLPLRQLDEFFLAFQCSDPSNPTQPRAAACRLFANAKTGKKDKSRRLSRPHGGLMSMLGF
ncbi:endothelin-converting enzyme, putative [Ixodes scapularis]|uniref:Endothelin-converting enzyme, putative n=1 Tax=Ixodes scapularis TaxID=6945 RepID=B7QJF8_IXOSC|nr:endothelin-converting enzyme, putative [Ixodes scapularis]|eukprot:XP_002415315.1 endothelin-converting enzyme, putative [Ixodes scapularis]